LIFGCFGDNRVWPTGWADWDFYDGSYPWSIKATAVCAR
jgi:hypothetical protein